MKWNSLSEMIEDLKLEADPSDEASVKAEVRHKISIIHPDKNNGQFASESAKERYVELTEALKFLESRNKQSQAIVSVDTSAIVQAISRTLVPTKEEILNRKQDECRTAYKLAVKSRYFFPRLKSGFFAGLCGLLLTFAEQLKVHPFFSQLLTVGYSFSPYFYRCLDEERQLQLSRGVNLNQNLDALNQAYSAALNKYAAARLSWLLPVLFILFIYSGVIFLFTWVNERKEEITSEWLLSEDGLRYILRQVLQRKSGLPEKANTIRFTKRDLASEIREMYKRKRRIRLPFQSYGEIASSFVEKTAKLHLDELSSRGIIRKIEKPKLDITYEVVEEIANELKEESIEAKA